MEKALQELFGLHFFWTPIPSKQYQNTSGCGTDQQKKFLHILLKTFDEQNSVGSFVKVFDGLMISHLVHNCWGRLVVERTSGGLLT